MPSARASRASRVARFLTTAVAHRLGLEPADGPMLTALRSVRDGYVMGTPDPLSGSRR